MGLFGMLLGDFNHKQLVDASPRFAGVFFASFMVLVFLTTVNVFIAMYRAQSVVVAVSSS